jgi:hypothetical protein
VEDIRYRSTSPLGLKRSPAVPITVPMAKKKKAAKKPDTSTTRRYRDALTGRFVTKKYAKKHRETTVKESAVSR